MEVKIPKDIREYQESMFWGLSLRQCVCSLLAVGIAVLLYFSLKDVIGTEQTSWRLQSNESGAFESISVSEPAGSEWSRTATSWLCIVGAAPFAACGFFKYHGLTAERFLWTWLKSEILSPKRLIYKPENIYYDCLFSAQAVAQRRKRK